MLGGRLFPGSDLRPADAMDYLRVPLRVSLRCDLLNTPQVFHDAPWTCSATDCRYYSIYWYVSLLSNIQHICETRTQHHSNTTTLPQHRISNKRPCEMYSFNELVKRCSSTLPPFVVPSSTVARNALRLGIQYLHSLRHLKPGIVITNPLLFLLYIH